MHLLIVESPAKAKTIGKYLGGDYDVIASFGHLRDLAAREGAVLPDQDFAMTWQISPERTKQLNEISRAVKKTDKLILATDPDREGEAISWHLIEALHDRKLLKGIPIERVVFNAITKSAVLEAIDNPRQIDENLVNAYLARRALDYLVGFTLSPVLWRKLPGIKSAGRVQSSALRLICEREADREQFKPQDFWTIDAKLQAKEGTFLARLAAIDGKRLQKFSLKSPQEAETARDRTEKAQWLIADIKSKPVSRGPTPPFTTSTLQQEASRKLGFSADRAMRCAQRLYDGSLGAGFITYMRTDSVNVTPSAITQMRDEIHKQFGEAYTPEKPNYYRSRAKNAQEAHEAIRPTDFAKIPSETSLKGDEARLYELIWKRTMASQMSKAQFQQTQLSLSSEDETLQARATGRVLIFDGFLRIYFEGRDLPENSDDDKEQKLPSVEKGERLKIEKATSDQHTTQPPPRFTEASLVKRMEELGIGRPSTYAPTMNVLRQRNYVVMDKKQLVPDSRGRIVTEFLKKYFSKYIDYNFTAGMEESLDKVSDGALAWRELLRTFWVDFIKAIDDTAELRITHVLDYLNEQLAPSVFPAERGGRQCPQCDKGQLSIRLGKFGAFVGCANYPDCKYTRSLLADENEAAAERELGTCPETHQIICAKSGRFGPYVERAQMEDEKKPKRSPIPKSISPQEIDLAQALNLLSLPRVVGEHPEDGAPITAGIGRFGAFVKHGKLYANLEDDESVLDIGLNRAVALLVEKKRNPKSRWGKAVSKGKLLGEHPDGGEIRLLTGRYGPYVKHDKVNASLNDIEPDEMSLAQAIVLIDERRAKAPAKKKRAAKKKTAKKTTKKAVKKKVAKKKAPKEESE